MYSGQIYILVWVVESSSQWSIVNVYRWVNKYFNYNRLYIYTWIENRTVLSYYTSENFLVYPAGYFMHVMYIYI